MFILRGGVCNNAPHLFLSFFQLFTSFSPVQSILQSSHVLAVLALALTLRLLLLSSILRFSLRCACCVLAYS